MDDAHGSSHESEDEAMNSDVEDPQLELEDAVFKFMRSRVEKAMSMRDFARESKKPSNVMIQEWSKLKQFKASEPAFCEYTDDEFLALIRLVFLKEALIKLGMHGENMRSKYFENKEHLMDTRWTFAESIFECYVEMGRSAAKVPSITTQEGILNGIQRMRSDVLNISRPRNEDHLKILVETCNERNLTLKHHRLLVNIDSFLTSAIMLLENKLAIWLESIEHDNSNEAKRKERIEYLSTCEDIYFFIRALAYMEKKDEGIYCKADEEPAASLEDDVHKFLRSSVDMLREKNSEDEIIPMHFLSQELNLVNCEEPSFRPHFYQDILGTIRIILLKRVLIELGTQAAQIITNYYKNEENDISDRTWKLAEICLNSSIKSGKSAEELMPIFSYEDTDVQTFNYVEVNSLVMSISNEWGNLFRTIPQVDDMTPDILAKHDPLLSCISRILKAVNGISRTFYLSSECRKVEDRQRILSSYEDIDSLIRSLSHLQKEVANIYPHDFLSKMPLDIKMKIFQYVLREDLCMLSRTSKELMKNIKHSKSIRNIKWRTMLLEIVQLSELCYGFSYFTQRYQRKSCKVKEKINFSNLESVARYISNIFARHYVMCLKITNMRLTGKLLECLNDVPEDRTFKSKHIMCNRCTLDDTSDSSLTISNFSNILQHAEIVDFRYSPNFASFINEKFLTNLAKGKVLWLPFDTVLLYDYRFTVTESFLSHLQLFKVLSAVSMILNTENVFKFIKMQLISGLEKTEEGKVKRTVFQFSTDQLISLAMLAQAFPQPDYECILNPEFYSSDTDDAPADDPEETHEDSDDEPEDEGFGYYRVTKRTTDVKYSVDIETRIRMRPNDEILYSLVLKFYKQK